MKSFRQLTVIFSLALLIGTVALTIAHRTDTSPNWLIISSYQYDVQLRDISMINIETGEIRQLTRHPISGNALALSPDRRWIYFYVDQFGYTSYLHISRVRTFGNGLQTITTEAQNLYFGGFTPDKQRIILHGGSSLNLIQPDGTDFEILAQDQSIFYFQGVSPDGKWIIFNASNESDSEDVDLFRIPSNGGEIERITDKLDGFPDDGLQIDTLTSWSSNGQWLYYSHGFIHAGSIQLRTKPDGSLTQVLTTTSGYNFITETDDGAVILTRPAGEDLLDLYRLEPSTMTLNLITQLTASTNQGRFSISPDGQWGYYYLYRNGSTVFHRVNFDTGIKNTIAAVEGGRLLWTPDGEWIVFNAQVDGYSKLFKSRPDGSDMQMLTSIEQNEYANVWMTLPTYDWQPIHLIIFSFFTMGITVLRIKRRRQPQTTTST